MGKGRWHSVTRTLQQLDADEMRTRSENIPRNLQDSVLLLVKHGTEPVREYVYGDTDSLARAGELAGFTLSPLDEEPDLPDGADGAAAHPLVPFRARLNSKSNMEQLRTSSEETRRSIETFMPEDSYVSMCIRKPGYWEQKRIRNWVNDERSMDADDSPLVSASAMCARVSVGCANPALNAELAKNVGLALCPLLSDMSSHKSRPRLAGFLVSLAATLLTLLAGLVSPISLPQFLVVSGLAFVTLIIFGVLSMFHVAMPPQVAAACGGLILYAALLMLPLPIWLGAIPLVAAIGFGIRWWRWTIWDDIMQRPRHYYEVTKDRLADDSDKETKLGMKDNRTRVTGYGTQRTTLVLAPLITTAMYTPTTTGAMTQQAHPVPELLTHGGVYLGRDQTGRRAYILPEQLFGCVAIFGAAGRGKSVLTHGIMQWATSNRDSTDPKEWGPDTRIIDFEMKDDSGVRVMNKYRQRKWPYDRSRPNVHPENRHRQGNVSYLADPNSPCPDMLGMLDGLNARETGTNVAAAMQRAFEPGDILNDSLDIIGTAMTIAVAVQRYCDTHDKVDGENPIIHRMHQMESQYPGAGQAEPQRSPIGWCLMALAGSDGQASSARALGHVCRALALETRSVDMTLAAKAAEQLYGRPDEKGHKISDQRILDRTNASRNKVRQFMDCEHVFTARRGRITWDMVLRNPSDYHFVLCDRQMADGSVRRLPDRMNRILGKWMMYRLWNTVKRNCQDWRATGKHSMFVCDEVSLLADTDDTILREMKDQGRSFGWFTVFATQYPDQLPPLLLTSVMGYNTFISFDNSDPDMAEKTARRLTSRDGEDGWDAAAVQNLPLYTAAVRTRAGEQLQPAFIVNVENFDSIS